jgi:putative DNA primase/helicase
VGGSEALGNVLNRLKNVRQESGGYQASCPVPSHGKGRGDRNPSLSLSTNNEGTIVLKCHAGCSTEEVVKAIDLGLRDLFPQPSGYERNGPRTPSASWPIKDASGEVQAVHDRFDKPGGKDCSWRLPGEKEYGLKGRKVASLPLYRTELVGAWPEDVPVVLTEGEKCADALARVYPAVLGTVTGASSIPGP